MTKQMQEIIMQIMQKKQKKLDTVPIQDIKEELLADFKQSFEQLLLQGEIYLPRHNIAKLTRKEF